jgi:membrane protease YdiL (CAAX protease family)
MAEPGMEIEPAATGGAAVGQLENVLSPAFRLGLAVALLVLEQIIAFVLWSLDRPVAALLTSAILGVVLPLVLLLRAWRIPIRAGLWLDRPSGRELGRLLWMMVAALPLTYALSGVSRHWFPPDDSQFEIYRALIPNGPGQLLLGALAAVVVVPLAEEILFRRLALGAVVYWLDGMTATLLSGVLFGIAHGAAWMVLPIAFLGSLFGWIVVRTGSLSLSWLAHGLFNLVAYIELCHSRDPRSARLEHWAVHQWVWLPCLILFVAWMLAEWRAPRRRRDRDAPTRSSLEREADDSRSAGTTHPPAADLE